MNIDGTNGADSLAGTDGADSIRGLDGDDTLNGLNGDDTVLGGAGNDHIRGEEFDLDPWTGVTPTGDDVLDGGDGDDSIIGGNGADSITGGAGNDAIGGDDVDFDGYDGVTPSGDDTIDAGGGADRIGGGGGQDLIYCGIGNDYAAGGHGRDTIWGGAGDDTLSSTGRADFALGYGVDGDRLYGEDGDDVFWLEHGGRSSTDPDVTPAPLYLDGGVGRDVITIANYNNLVIYLDQVAPADAVDVVEARRIEAIIANPLYSVPRVFGGDGGGRLQLDNVFSFEGGEGRDVISGVGAIESVYAYDYPVGIVFGGGGDDQIVLTGSGRVDGGDGDDILRIAKGTVSYESAAAGVTVTLGVKTAQDTGGAGVDVVVAKDLWGSEHGDHLTASAKGSAVKGLGGSDELTGGAREDSLEGGAGADTLTGGAGQDQLIGGDGNDSLSGGEDWDRLDAGLGNDVIDGGAGFDEVSMETATAGATVDLARTDRQTTSLGRDIYLNIEGLTGTGFDDRLSGAGAGEYLWALDGDDHVRGRGGSDTLGGGAGDDTLDGGDGDDLLYDGAPHFEGEAGSGVYRGGDGVDTLDWFDYSFVEVTIDLSLTAVQEVMPDVTMTLSGIENLTTGSSDDHLLGSDAANRLDGADGENTLNGRGGDDVLVAYQGLPDRNIYIGGDGFDVIDASRSEYTLFYDFEAQPTKFQGIEGVIGGRRNDTLTAADEAARFEGRDGADTLKGGTGADTLNGGTGNDRIIGSGGADDMIGSKGADTFAYFALSDSGETSDTADLIRDFDPGKGDVVNLVKIDAVAGTAANEAFHFVNDFTGAAGEAELTYIAARKLTVLDLDVNGDAMSDMRIVFRGLVTDDAGWVL